MAEDELFRMFEDLVTEMPEGPFLKFQCRRLVTNSIMPKRKSAELKGDVLATAFEGNMSPEDFYSMLEKRDNAENKIVRNLKRLRADKKINKIKADVQKRAIPAWRDTMNPAGGNDWIDQVVGEFVGNEHTEKGSQLPKNHGPYTLYRPVEASKPERKEPTGTGLRRKQPKEEKLKLARK